MENTSVKEKLSDLKSGKISCLDNLNHFLANIEENNEHFFAD